MILAELKKIWRSKILWGFFAALFVLNCINIFAVGKRAETEPEFDAARARVYAQVRGEWNAGTLKFVIDTYENAAAIVASRSYSTEPNQPGTYTGYIFGDFSLFGELYEEMRYMYQYAEDAQATVDKATENAAFYTAHHNRFSARESEQISVRYSGRKIDAYYRTDGAYALISYDMSSVFVLLLCALCISAVFTLEHETEMNALLRLTKHGGRALNRAKIAASLITAESIALLFYIADFLSFLCVYRIDCLRNPIYSIPTFQNTPFSCAIWQYLLILLANRMLGAAIFSLLFLLCSKILRRGLPAFCMSLSVTVLLIFSGGEMNPVMLFSVRDLHRSYQVYDICGYPVLRHTVLMIVTVLFASALVILISVPHTKRRHRHDRAL